MNFSQSNLIQENKTFISGFNNYNYYYNTNNDKNNTLNYFSKFDNKINGNYYIDNYRNQDNESERKSNQYNDYYYNNGNNNNFEKRNYNGNGRGRKEYFQNHNNYNNNNNRNYNGNGNNYYNKNMHYKKKTFTYNMRWDGYDPFTVKSLIYRAESYIMSRYPNLGMVNNKNEGFSNKITDKSKYFVIKSFNEEDVHKAIKYSLWSSTNAGNQTLNEAFKQTQKEGGEVYLFFSCNGSGRYIGVARMINEFNESKEFNFWTQDSKWKGFFDVEWIFIKDIPFKCFKMINIMMK